MDYELLKNGNVKVGEKFNNLIINSTRGIINTENIDKNIILFSYKEDFFYISEIEILELKKNEQVFNELDTQIILMTTGNLLSHYAWIEHIKRKTGTEINYPIIEDKIGENCRKYGMYSKENNNEIISKTVIISKKKTAEAIFEYSNNIPRNIYEIIRVLNFLKNRKNCWEKILFMIYNRKKRITWKDGKVYGRK